ncbi:MAG: FMN-binding protein [Ilumatobacteraceae bacterium]
MNNRSTHSLGSRLLPAVAMTAAASGLIALLDRPTTGSAGTGGLDTGIGLPSQSTAVVPSQPPVVSSTLPVTPVPVQPQQQPAPQQPLPTTPPVPVKTTAAPATGGACTGTTKDGPSISTRWGPVQVEAIISSSGQICNVGAIRSPNSHGTSIRINQVALPILHRQVMKAQSVNINGVSGATITSEGYVESLQAILNGG